jgi:hypothetical protein
MHPATEVRRTQQGRGSRAPAGEDALNTARSSGAMTTGSFFSFSFLLSFPFLFIFSTLLNSGFSK